jgi:hypothetical protein
MLHVTFIESHKSRVKTLVLDGTGNLTESNVSGNLSNFPTELLLWFHMSPFLLRLSEYSTVRPVPDLRSNRNYYTLYALVCY